MVVFTLTLVRHGETKANKERIIQGQSDVPLSEVGFIQATHVATRLKNEKFTHVYSSDLSRASKTAQKIVEKNCLIDQNVEIRLDPRLRERKYGEVEGKTVNEMRKLAKDYGISFINFNPKGSETVDRVRNRAISFFKDLCQSCCDAENDSSENEKKAMKVCNCNGQAKPESRKTLESCAQLSDQAISVQVNSGSCDCDTSRLHLTSLPKVDEAVSSPDCHKSQQSHRSAAAANVLLVSHGGLIRELIKYFVEDLGCEVPGSKDHVSRISPNTGLSVFNVSVNVTEVPKITCLIIHDQSHLSENGQRLALCNEETV